MYYYGRNSRKVGYRDVGKPGYMLEAVRLVLISEENVHVGGGGKGRLLYGAAGAAGGRSWMKPRGGGGGGLDRQRGLDKWRDGGLIRSTGENFRRVITIKVGDDVTIRLNSVERSTGKIEGEDKVERKGWAGNVRGGGA